MLRPMVGPDSSRLLRERIVAASIALMGIFAIGTFGYYAMGRFYLGKFSWDLGECAYMTVITITTVGFGELPHLARVPGGRIFTVGVLLAAPHHVGSAVQKQPLWPAPATAALATDLVLLVAFGVF